MLLVAELSWCYTKACKNLSSLILHKDLALSCLNNCYLNQCLLFSTGMALAACGIFYGLYSPLFFAVYLGVAGGQVYAGTLIFFTFLLAGFIFTRNRFMIVGYLRGRWAKPLSVNSYWKPALKLADCSNTI